MPSNLAALIADFHIAWIKLYLDRPAGPRPYCNKGTLSMSAILLTSRGLLAIRQLIGVLPYVGKILLAHMRSVGDTAHSPPRPAVSAAAFACDACASVVLPRIVRYPNAAWRLAFPSALSPLSAPSRLRQCSCAAYMLTVQQESKARRPPTSRGSPTVHRRNFGRVLGQVRTTAPMGFGAIGRGCARISKREAQPYGYKTVTTTRPAG